MEKTGPMSDEERLKLAEKLDNELDEFINGLEKRQYTEGWPEDRWEEEMEKHPFFMKKAPEPGDELSPLMEGLQKLKYDPEENTPNELAFAYKDDGNFNFKYKKYRLAILSYTEGIKIGCDDRELQASLYNNRSASHFHLKNYRSALRDSEVAIKINPNYAKALFRAAQCCFELEMFEKAIEFCERVDSKDSTDLKIKCVNGWKIKEKNERKKLRTIQKITDEEAALIGAIKERNIRIAGKRINLSSIEPVAEQIKGNRVSLTDGRLTWPVLFLYPELKRMDFVQNFCEVHRFQQHLDLILLDRSDWDLEHKYQPNSVKLYYLRDHEVFFVDSKRTLKEILSLPSYLVSNGTPAFLVFAKDSEAERRFLNEQKCLKC